MAYKYHKKTAEERRKEVDELAGKIPGEVEKYKNSEEFKRILDNLSQFYSRYSLNNCILIAMQRPDASLVGSYQTWQQVNRQVKRGEHGIAILHPVPFRYVKDEPVMDAATGTQKLNADGTPITEEKEVSGTSFKIGYVFDISQTEQIPGKEVMELSSVHRLSGDVSDYENMLETIRKVSPVPIRIEKFSGDANGYFSRLKQEIVIQDDMSQLQTIKTACHELSHAWLHNNPAATHLSRADKEMQAEGTSYVVMKHFQNAGLSELDPSSYTFPYLNGWQGDTDGIKQNLEIIKTASSEIIEKMDSALLEVMESRQKIDEKSVPNLDELADKLVAYDKEFEPEKYQKTEVYKGAVHDQYAYKIRQDRLDEVSKMLRTGASEESGKRAEKAEDLLKDIEKYRSVYAHKYEKEEIKLSRTRRI